MNKILLCIGLCCVVNTINGQAIYETLHSNKLNEDRQLKIQLPRGYSNDDSKKYPLIVVFDGDYLFEAVAGDVDYFSYWEDMPEAIVVGIKQGEQRYDDCTYSEQNSLPVEKGANFFEFIGYELVPYMEDKYKTENFRVAVGHGETANFINYYVLKDVPLFQAYISISPDLAPQMGQYITDRFNSIDSQVFYYLATSSNVTPLSTEKSI